jgi:predicted secreted protein
MKPRRESKSNVSQSVYIETADAVRDLEYLQGLAPVQPDTARDYQVDLFEAFQQIAERPGAPFNTAYRTFRSESHQQSDAIREALRRLLPRGLAWSPAEMATRGDDYWRGKHPEIYSASVHFIAKFLMAFLVGTALIVPMIIMVFNPSRTKSLITTSVSVLLVAAFCALGITATNEQTIAATATYTAVLVVFVGTSTTPSVA